jgi:hypothetical protein
MAPIRSNRGTVVRTLLIVLVGQVGCLTLLIVLSSVLLGLWLDATFHTKPLLTLVLLFAGIPVSVLLMLLVARRTLRRIADENELTGKEAG